MVRRISSSRRGPRPAAATDHFNYQIIRPSPVIRSYTFGPAEGHLVQDFTRISRNRFGRVLPYALLSSFAPIRLHSNFRASSPSAPWSLSSRPIPDRRRRRRRHFCFRRSKIGTVRLDNPIARGVARIVRRFCPGVTIPAPETAAPNGTKTQIRAFGQLRRDVRDKFGNTA